MDASPSAYARHTYQAAVRMGDCYPYKTDLNNQPVVMTYDVNWGDGSPESNPNANVGATADVTHSWNSKGTYQVHAAPLTDSHGRKFPQQENAQLDVNVQYATPADNVQVETVQAH